MAVQFYMDENVSYAITEGLRLRDVDVLTVEDERLKGTSDPEVLDRATALGRVLFSRDTDLLREAHERQSSGTRFSGVIYAHQQDASIGRCVQDLELIAKVGEPEDFAGRVIYLPLK